MVAVNELKAFYVDRSSHARTDVLRVGLTRFVPRLYSCSRSTSDFPESEFQPSFLNCAQGTSATECKFASKALKQLYPSIN
jgi:hypothetical protein